MLDELLLFTAGVLGGVLNAIAGGGSFVTFPALLLAGVPPIAANATNTFASCAGYLSGAYAFRAELQAHAGEAVRLVWVSVLGGLLGAWLLLQTPEQVFAEAVPWLLLLATLLFVWGGRLNALLARLAGRSRHASRLGSVALLLLLLGVCIYGGFFNAGLGIVTLSYLALAGHTDMHVMNGLKLLVSAAISLVAIVLFVRAGSIAWLAGISVMLGTLIGSYVAARISRRVSPEAVRVTVIVIGVAVTAFYFQQVYL